MTNCIPILEARTTDGHIKWKCARCGYNRHTERHGNFPDRIFRPCNIQLDVSGKRIPAVGDSLTQALREMGFDRKLDCGCESLARWMNNIGPSGCRDHIDFIESRLMDNAKLQSWWAIAKATAIALSMGVTSVRSLIELAITMATTEMNQTS